MIAGLVLQYVVIAVAVALSAWAVLAAQAPANTPAQITQQPLTGGLTPTCRPTVEQMQDVHQLTGGRKHGVACRT